MRTPPRPRLSPRTGRRDLPMKMPERTKRTKTQRNMEGWTRIQTVPQPFQADLLKATLEAQGFSVLILNKRDSSYGTFGEVEVHVPAQDAQRAADWLASFQGGEKDA